MAFQRPTLSDLITRIGGDFSSRLLNGASTLRRGIITVFARVIAGAVHLFYGYMDWAAKQLFLDSCDDDFVPRFGLIFGVPRKNATFAVYTLSATGTNGVVIPALDSGGNPTQWQFTDGTLFNQNANVTIAGGVASPSVTAVLSGSAPNRVAGDILTLVSPIPGVNSAAAVQAGGTNGVAVEDIEAWRARILEKVQQAPDGGSKDDYVMWALQCVGVTRAWCTQNYLGIGTVGLTFVMDNKAGSIIPASGDVATVQAYIDDPTRRPVTAALTVYAPTANPLNLSIHLNPDTTAIRSAVQAQVQDLLTREGAPGATIHLSHIREVVAIACGSGDFTMASPSADFTSTATQIATMGTITWT